MKKAIIGKKIGMTQIFTENGTVVPVTVVEAGPCVVVQKKNMDVDAYGDVKEKRVTKPLKGHYDKHGVEYKKVIREFKLDDYDAFETGQVIKADMFEAGDKEKLAAYS